MLLDDSELWMDHLTFLWECAVRKSERTTEDETFLLHNRGVITSTFTGDCLLTEGEIRDKLGEWLKNIHHTCESLSEIHTMTHHWSMLTSHTRGTLTPSLP